MPAVPGLASSFSPSSRLGERTLVLLTSLLATVFTLTWAFRAKTACAGAPFDEFGRSLRFPSGDSHAIVPCYSDVMMLWIGRDIDRHVFPYIHGGIDSAGQLFGGVVEYPVLSGLLMWIGGIGAHTDLAFLEHSALILAPFAIAITVLLALMTRWWVLLWAATPPLVLYAFHNWELPVVFTAVAAVGVMAFGASVHPRTGRRRISLRTTAVVASVLLAIGFSLKIYPGFFVLPLAAYVLTGGHGPRVRRALDWTGAIRVAVAAVVTVALTQIPFMIAGFDGWRAALTFQGKREADNTTNSIWFWGLRHLTGGETNGYDSIVDIASPLLIVLGFAAAMWLGWKAYRDDGVFPWLGVAAAMLAAFMVFHKVHSPQYTLWILPFFVLLRVRWWWIAAYLVSDFTLDATIFRYLGFDVSDSPAPWWVLGGVNLGVWVHAAILLTGIVAFVRTPLREPLASYLRSAPPPAGPLTRLAASDATDARTWLGAPTLTRGDVTLRPLTASDASALAALISESDRELYRWTSPIPGTAHEATEWIVRALSDPARIPFAVLYGGRLVGTTSYYDVQAEHRSLAIGHTFYTPGTMGTQVNPAAKMLLLEYAFATCGATRVVWHTHESNARSRAAISKLGAEFEGLLRKHRRFGDGWRTTAQFAMTDDDWPGVRDELAMRSAR
ncbi:GNAT family N-acetyltransferase [Gordonia zhaorongruii]|uniref:GNAT family N-acetyltransferase n=1 Tax=Gordonia zhaorongruii TaxID=2597659 RepID=UPI00117E374A|nr:GNAT family N-acetyltransferase [Gordonia zhaorongruii]